MRDRVGVVLEQRAAAREHHQAVAVGHHEPPHAQHAPGPVPDVEDAGAAADHLAVHLQEAVAQLVHPLEQRLPGDHTLLEREQRRRGERNGGHGDHGADAAHHLSRQALQLRQPPLLGPAEQPGRRGGEPLPQGERRTEVHGRAAVAPQPAGEQAQRVAPDVGCHRAELGEASRPVALVQQLADQRAVLEHAVVVQRHGNEPDVPCEPGVERGATDVVEQAEFRGSEPPVTREAALGKDSLRDAVPRDELHVPLQHRVVQRFAESAAHEVGPERLEHVLERPGAGPLPDGVAHVHPPREHVGHDDVIGVGAVVHEVDHDVPLGDPLEGRLVLVVDAHLVEDVHQDLGEVVAELVIGEDVELRDDLGDVLCHAATHLLLRDAVRAGVVGHRSEHHGIATERRLRQPPLLQLVAPEAHPELVDRAEGVAAEPPPHVALPPSFFKAAYPMPRRIVIHLAIGGCVASRSARKPSWLVSRRPSGSAMQRCAAPCLMCVVGASAASILWSALASARGLRVNCAPIASARYSRFRLTARARSWEMIGARIQDTIHTTSRTATSGPRFFLPPRPPPPPPPPPPAILPEPRLKKMRVAPSRISSTAPTRAASVVMSRTSRFFTCPSSWPMTAWSSSRLQRSSSPWVTATWAWLGSTPVANAFGSGSGTIQICGRGTPAAIAISSTTFTSWRCWSVAGSRTSSAPVAHSTFSGPVEYAYQASSTPRAVAAIPN